MEPVRISLSPGLEFSFHGGDDYGRDIVSFLASVIAPPRTEYETPRRRLIIHGPSDFADPDYNCPVLKRENVQALITPHLPSIDSDHVALNALWILLAIARDTEALGGLLVHGALAAREGIGVLLSGRSEEGKTTASRRLPPHWTSHSDDATLVIPGMDGQYRAHPWPTRGDVILGRHTSPWDVSRSLPLGAIFFLTKAEKDHAGPIGQGEALCMLSQTAEQLSLDMTSDDVEDARSERTHRFSNVTAVVKSVRSYRLHHTMGGKSWKEMERVLEPVSAGGPDAVSRAAPAAAGR